MQLYDVTVLGGGIAGLGVADASTDQGLSTAVLEAKRVGHATSNNTLRIIHGGFRYLQQLNAPRVIRSLNDQIYVSRTFPDAVTSLPCLMPLQRYGLKSSIPVGAAAYLYGSIMRLCCSTLPGPALLSARQIATVAPLLQSLAPHGALCWHDLVMTNPERIHATLCDRIRSRGGEIHEQSKVTQVTKSRNGFLVRTETGLELETKTVVCTLGPWMRSIDSIPTQNIVSPQWCLGFNLTISRQLHPTHALAVQSHDRRLFFCVPRGQHTAIGTWYIPWKPPACSDAGLKKPDVPEREIESFIASFNQAFQSNPLHRNDIIEIDAGILPMRTSANNGPILYGAERFYKEDGFFEVMSTKYTTFRSQGQTALGLITRYLEKATSPLSLVRENNHD